MESYHLAWLKAHPERSAEWLREKIAEGFQVHHVDGDHSNDEPSNLLLIDGVDHIRLHAGSLRAGINSWRNRQRGPRTPVEDDPVGRDLYFQKAKDDRPWKTLAAEFHGGVKPDGRIWTDIGQTLQWRARRFAKRNNLPWPPTAEMVA